MNKNKEVIIIGFALFAMFFGAGNLIFPPSLGVATGGNWVLAGLGFLVTGVGLPLLGILAFAKVGSLNSFADKVAPNFNTIFCTVLTLVIGPLFAIPRTASTTFELSIQPLLGNNGSILFPIFTSIIFFTISYLLTIKEEKITDIIGKYLTPIILILLAIIGVIGIVKDMGIPIIDKMPKNTFAYGFVNGYQTMDALASILFGVVIVKDLIGKGIVDKVEQQSYLRQSGIIAAIGLGVIYFILVFLGAKISGMEYTGTTGPVVYLAEYTLGVSGRILFGICVALACLTTSVGVTAFVADWLSKLLPFSYKKLAFVISLFSSVIAIGGVDFIVKGAVPILILLYPTTIVLILLNLSNFSERIYFQLSVPVILIISIIEVLGTVFKISLFQNIINQIPLGNKGFSWLVPFVITVIIAYLITKFKSNSITK